MSLPDELWALVYEKLDDPRDRINMLRTHKDFLKSPSISSRISRFILTTNNENKTSMLCSDILPKRAVSSAAWTWSASSRVWDHCERPDGSTEVATRRLFGAAERVVRRAVPA